MEKEQIARIRHHAENCLLASCAYIEQIYEDFKSGTANEMQSNAQLIGTLSRVFFPAITALDNLNNIEAAENIRKEESECFE